MKRKMQGLLWLFLLEYALMVTSLEPGFLDFDNLPDTNFSCVGKVIGGYYADLETNCQMFHVCTIGQLDEPMDIRFLCLNGTVFDQETRVCERIDEVDCSKSEQFYSLNLELYGNTQPPILEESPENEYSSDSKKMTTSTAPPTSTSTFAPYFPPSPPTTNHDISKVITSHHFPVNSPDIRFNPEEINISLKAGAPPDISRSQVPISYQQQSFSEKNTRVTVTTHTTIYRSEKHRHRPPILSTTNPPIQSLTEKPETTITPKSVVSYGLTHNQGSPIANPTEINYGFSFPQTDDSLEYHTVQPHPYQYQLSLNNFRPSAQGRPYHSSYRNGNKRQQKSNYPATTYKNNPTFTPSTRASRYSSQTEKPNLQLPLPLLPTLSSLSFSSPSPFSLDHHIETKRYTKDHQSPPRIIISASASVSDNNGRRLNYSLGQIGASHFLGSSPASYDDYKEEDVMLDPFYLDVPKLKKSRSKRSVSDNDDIIRNDEEAEDLLRYIFHWYRNREQPRQISIPVTAEDITDINHQLAPVLNADESSSAEQKYETLFRKILTENCTDHYNDSRTENPIVTTTVTVNNTVTSLNRKKHTVENGPLNQKVTEKPITSDAHIHSHREIHVQLTEDNYTKEYQDSDYLNNYSVDAQTKENNKLSIHSLQDGEIDEPYDYLDENSTVLENLFYDDLLSQNNSFKEYDQENLTTTIATNLTTLPTTESIKEVTTMSTENYDYNVADYDYSNHTLKTPINNITEHQLKTVSESAVNASDYFDLYDTDNIYEDFGLDSTTVTVTTDSIPTTLDDVNVNNTESATLEMLVLETQSNSQEKWDKASTAQANSILLTSKELSTEKIDVKPKVDIIRETTQEKITEQEQSVFAIPDYVDDNYEPLTYQIHSPENITSNGMDLTTESKINSLTTNLEIETSTELERTVSIDIPENVTEGLLTTETSMTEFPTIQTTESTTIPVNAATTFSTETTIVMESTVETTTEQANFKNENLMEPTTPIVTENTFQTTSTPVDITTVTDQIFVTKSSPQTYKNHDGKKEYPKHRFSSSSEKRARERHKFHKDSVINTHTNLSKLTTKSKVNLTPTPPSVEEEEFITDMHLTDAPLLKSANPTKSKHTRVVLSTTPLSKIVRIQLRKGSNNRRYTFNCFNKKVHQFYSDPRDCRLFHYCTPGYSKNQLVDMKFVCDLGTYYDDEKFMCTEVKPARCG